MIGLGSIGQRHVRNIRRVYGDSVEIIAYRARGLHHTFSDTMQIRDGVIFEDEYKVKSYYDFDEALSEKPDVAFITNITSEHIPSAINAAKAGCNLFIEKPLSFNLDGIEELKKIIEEKDLIAMMGFQNRHHVCLKEVKELLSLHTIGDVVSVDVEMGERLVTMHTYEDYRGTYMAQKKMGGGVIFNQQIHELDYIAWLFGKPTSVYSVNGHLSDLEVDVEDVCSSIYVLEKDGKRIPVYAHADFLQSPSTRRCKIIGTNGIIEVDLLKPSIDIFVNGKEPISKVYDTFNRNDMFIDELKEFMNCVANHTQPKTSLDDGVFCLKMALASCESAEGKKPILIN